MEWPLLASLAESDRERLLASTRRRSFAKGEVVVHEGDPADSLHLVESGRLAVRVTTVDGASQLRDALLKYSDRFVQTVTEKLMTYALGRGLEYYDMPVVRGITRAAAKNDYRFSSVVMGIVESEPFLMRAVETEPPATEIACRTVRPGR